MAYQFNLIDLIKTIVFFKMEASEIKPINETKPFQFHNKCQWVPKKTEIYIVIHRTSEITVLVQWVFHFPKPHSTHRSQFLILGT